MRWPDLHGVALAAALVTPLTLPGHELHLLHQQRYAMGTMWDVVAYHGARAGAEGAIAEALAEVERLDRVMSHFDASSELAALVRTARRGIAHPSTDLYDVIDASLHFSRLSGGRFDVTVAPLVRAHRRAREEGRVISEAERAAAQACVGYSRIEIGAGSIRFASDCLDLDLGGIAKGYAVDRAIEILRRAGITHALVNAGGSSIAAFGAPPGHDGWPVEAANRLVSLRNGSVSTSEATATPGPGGEIVDASTGTPLVHGLAVSVFAPTATVSDALATTLLTMPVPDGMRLLERMPDVAAVWRTPTGEIAATYQGSDETAPARVPRP